MPDNYEVTTFYSNNTPYCQELRISLRYPDWCELEKKPFYRDLIAYLERLETRDTQKGTTEAEQKAGIEAM